MVSGHSPVTGETNAVAGRSARLCRTGEDTRAGEARGQAHRLPGWRWEPAAAGAGTAEKGLHTASIPSWEHPPQPSRGPGLLLNLSHVRPAVTPNCLGTRLSPPGSCAVLRPRPCDPRVTVHRTLRQLHHCVCLGPSAVLPLACLLRTCAHTHVPRNYQKRLPPFQRTPVEGGLHLREGHWHF